MDGKIGRNGAIDLLQEFAELNGAMAWPALPDHGSRGDVQGSEKAGGAMTLVIVGAAFGLARQSYYNARKALAGHGLAGLIPARPGPHGGHKLTAAVVDFLEQQAAADPAPSSAQLAAAVADQFGVTVHKRSVERALAARRAAGNQQQEAAKRSR